MKRGNNFYSCKHGQIAVFVVIALVLVAGIAGLFILRDKIFKTSLPSELVPIYDHYLSCIESNIDDGISLLGAQAGYIESPEFEPGSEYAPFSSHLDFMGTPVPYWYYLSGNGIIKEQIPSKKQMQNQLNAYLEDNLEKCDFSIFKGSGYIINLGKADVSTTISDNKVLADVSQPLSITREDEEKEGPNVVVRNHKAEVNSQIGKFYEIALNLYNYEKEKMFLENYAVDVLYLYAPVTGSKISCKPLLWNPYEIIEDLQNALQANIQSLKVKGDYYDLSSNDKEYFVVNPGFNLANSEQVNFLYAKQWPSRFEIWPTKNDVMMAKVVGPQQGLSAAGFCYVSYKFVYDIYFPVLIQVHDMNNAEDVFQFPIAVVVNKNQPREAMETGESLFVQESICDNANTNVNVYTYDSTLAPVEADVDFKCFADICKLGKTQINERKEAVLEAKVPQCVNGILTASADGYKDEKYYISTNDQTIADIAMDKKYSLDLGIFVDGKLTKETAVLTISENLENGETEVIDSVAYPFVSKIELAEGDYTFNLVVYKDKSITLPASEEKQCVKVPKQGVLGILGLEDEECFDYSIPSQTVSSIFYAGGTQVQYIPQSELAGSNQIKIYAESIATPSNLEELQKTFDLIEVKNLAIKLN